MCYLCYETRQLDYGFIAFYRILIKLHRGLGESVGVWVSPADKGCVVMASPDFAERMGPYSLVQKFKLTKWKRFSSLFSPGHCPEFGKWTLSHKRETDESLVKNLANVIYLKMPCEFIKGTVGEMMHVGSDDFLEAQQILSWGVNSVCFHLFLFADLILQERALLIGWAQLSPGHTKLL